MSHACLHSAAGQRDIASAGTADSFHPWNSCRLVHCFVARPPGSLGAGARVGNVALAGRLLNLLG